MFTYFLPALYSMLQLFLIASIGFVLVRWKKVDSGFIRTLSLFLINIALPCWLFTKLITTGREDLLSSMMFLAAGVLVIAAGFILGRVLFFLFGMKDNGIRSGWAMSALGNSGYIPLSVSETLPVAIPAVAAVLPDETAALYIGMYLVTMNPILWTVGNYLVAGGVKRPRFTELFTPPAFSVIAGVIVVLLGGGGLFEDRGNILFYLKKSAETLGHTALPAVLIVLGGMIGQASSDGFRGGRKTVTFISTVVAVRMVLMPALFFLFYFISRRYITLEPVQYWVLFLEMITPPATNLSVMAARARRNEGLVAQTLFFSYLSYFIIFPFYLALFLSLPIFH